MQRPNFYSMTVFEIYDWIEENSKVGYPMNREFISEMLNIGELVEIRADLIQFANNTWEERYAC